jgi:hypothetical protein
MLQDLNLENSGGAQLKFNRRTSKIGKSSKNLKKAGKKSLNGCRGLSIIKLNTGAVFNQGINYYSTISGIIWSIILVIILVAYSTIELATYN